MLHLPFGDSELHFNDMRLAAHFTRGNTQTGVTGASAGAANDTSRRAVRRAAAPRSEPLRALLLSLALRHQLLPLNAAFLLACLPACFWFSAAPPNHVYGLLFL